jgi:superfamily II DNA or RNA helicase
MGIDRVQKYDGVLVADVVGLGKSIVGSAIAHNLDLPVVVIAPPHLKSQWEDYQEQFNLRGARVFSTGKIADVYEHYSKATRPTLFIIDEAHRYRNEDTNDYKLLHQVVRSHPENKVILLTATPFNNRPEDVFALLKLFQTPSRSTIRSVDNLSLRFRDLIDQYKQLQKLRRNKGSQEDMDKRALSISSELRRLIEMVVIRRSRLDLRKLTRYREDLERQHIDFATVVGPELLDYDLGELTDLYSKTLSQLTGDGADEGFIGARYKPTTYLKDDKAFLEKYGEYFDDTTLKTAQSNLSKFMRKLLVTRFESSKYAFQTTLEKMIHSNEIIIRWWDEAGRVPIMKKGEIPDPELFTEDTSDDFIESVDEVTNDSAFETLNKSGLLTVEKELFDDEYIESVKADHNLLKSIHEKWFGTGSLNIDPKLDGVVDRVKQMLSENKTRKIVIFSAYADTTDYLREQLTKRGFERVLSYTAKVGTTQMKNIIRYNFDAGLPEDKQVDDYDILIATDALSEGFNLHRAGIIINYDIPYNPTRVIQRIGRINRINKKVFDNIYIYNCFPTAVGESEIGIKQISTLKIKLINNVIGNDTKTLTTDEELKSFFKEELKNAEGEVEQESWDVKHREAYDNVRNDKAFLKEVMEINERSRLVRTDQKTIATVAFAKKGDHVLFAVAKNGEDPQIVSVETAINYFVARPGEKAIKADRSLDPIFVMLRDKLFANHEQPPIRGRRADALTNLKFLRENYPPSKDFCKDLEDIIRQYDDLSEGELKDIAQMRFKDGGDDALKTSLEELKSQFPVHYIQAIKERAERLDNEGEVIVLTEDLRS